MKKSEEKKIRRMLDRKLSHCTAEEKEAQFLIVKEYTKTGELEKMHRRYLQLSSEERLIINRFYGKFHRRWTVEAKEAADKIMDKILLKQ